MTRFDLRDVCGDGHVGLLGGPLDHTETHVSSHRAFT
jgi:hypothetical protein